MSTRNRTHKLSIVWILQMIYGEWLPPFKEERQRSRDVLYLRKDASYALALPPPPVPPLARRPSPVAWPKCAGNWCSAPRIDHDLFNKVDKKEERTLCAHPWFETFWPAQGPSMHEANDHIVRGTWQEMCNVQSPFSCSRGNSTTPTHGSAQSITMLCTPNKQQTWVIWLLRQKTLYLGFELASVF